MDMNPWERRQKILEVLCLRRHDTYRNLAHEFNVSTGTIRRDIVVLTCSYPVETVKGHHGGVRVAEWFHLDRRALNSVEITFLRRLGESLDGPDLEMLNLDYCYLFALRATAMQMKISDIKINPGRRDTQQRNVEELARSIAAVGLMNPITVTQDNTLIAGLHRLEAVKLLGWTEIECVVSEADGLQAELAEIDENFVRAGLSHRELGDLLLLRKELYEAIHPETRQGQRNGQTAKNANFSLLETKSFAQDTADKLGVSKRTVEQLVQTARDLTPEAKKTIRDAGDKITKGAALKISRLPPDQQEEAAAVLTIAPPAPKRKGMMDSEAALREFTALCSRYVSGIEALHHRADIFAGMTISQFDALGDSAYSVTTAIKGFFEKVHEIRHEMEKEHEN